MNADLKKTAADINLLAGFCGVRDIDRLDPSSLHKNYGIDRADVLILFGGSIPAGCDTAAEGFLRGTASRLMIVGGEGHTTKSLRSSIHAKYPEIPTGGRMEADMMKDYITKKYGIQNILLERKSTNCGNNVTNALEVLNRSHIDAQHVILIQDASMQRRMSAGFSKHAPDIKVINYAAYRNPVQVKDGKLKFSKDTLWGMWEMEHYISLLMGEIPRLSNTKEGYGPKGHGYIAEVQIPETVMQAFQDLKQNHSEKIRTADPRYASL